MTGPQPRIDPAQAQAVAHKFTALRSHIQNTIIGQPALIERLLVCVLANGHVLLEGLPGLAKTTAVHCLANGMALSFQRIQFTPDLIPGDITGAEIFLTREGEFKFIEGPIFHQIVLADEINRAPPKVQSALLEAMQERQVTVAGATRPLPSIFQVIATQNPLEHAGTYPLPEAQLDRFLMKVHLDYPGPDDELEILRRDQQQTLNPLSAPATAPVNGTDIETARQVVNEIYMDDMLQRYIVTFIGATRSPQPWWPEAGDWLSHGASPRATLALARAARALALLRQRDFVEPADIMDIARDVLNHRLGLSFSARAEGITTAQFIDGLLERVPVP